MVDYEKLDIDTLKVIYDEYQIMAKRKRDELKIINAEIEIIEAFIDHCSKFIYRKQQFLDKQEYDTSKLNKKDN